MKVAIQGERGAFSHQAALQLLPGTGITACQTSLQVFDALDAGAVRYAVIPVENTLAGPVGEHLDLLLERDVFVQREFRLRIEHCLIAAPGTEIDDIRQVISHPVALDQCRNFFRKRKKIHPLAFYDTAGAVKHVLENKLNDVAAIAGRQAAEEYNGTVLLSGLEDNKQNFTRFFLTGKAKKVASEADKTSVVFSLKNEPGALFKALSVFALRELDMCKIESRPMRGKPWEYVFFVDLLRGNDQVMRNALRHLEEIAGLVKVLGVYPRAR
ncbi:MAG TPA: prephenate dehydratase [Candidatus Angelobacter sp.]|nr:prephenate dehydratase [Candidatus Angelobacter sp.]